MAQNSDQKGPSPGRRRTLGLIVASAVATAPLGCDDGPKPADAATTMAALDGAVPEDGAVEASTGREDALAMDTGPQVDAMATADSGTSDATDPADAGQEYPSGVRG